MPFPTLFPVVTRANRGAPGKTTKRAAARKIKILIADDHPVVRVGLRQILSAEPDLIVGGEAASSAEVLQLARRERWDVVVLDLTMPGRGGLEALRDLKREHPKLPVLVLSVHPEDQFAIRVLRAGASGYLTKESASDELVTAIRRSVAGGKYLSPALAENLALDLDRGADKASHARLSDREYLVMTMIASGKSVTDIARELALSPNAISTYRARVLQKLNLRNTTEIIRYALERQLVK